jgi:hypothetical protein
VEPSGPPPEAREAATWTVDPASGAAYLFGGRGVGGDLGDLWAYDLAADRWLRLEPIGEAPAARSGHVAAWLDGLGLVVFGGRSGTDTLDDLWVYDPDANGWRPLTTDGPAPSARWGSCSGVAPDGQLWVSHGAAAGGTPLGDTWSYLAGPSVWTPIRTASVAPPPRSGAACWFADDGRFAMLGGRTADEAATGELWSMSAGGDAWTALESVTGSARTDAAVARSAPAGVAAGGMAPTGEPLADVVTVDALTLELVVFAAATGGPTPRAGAALVDDPGNERMLLFGGRDATGLQPDVWSLDLP